MPEAKTQNGAGGAGQKARASWYAQGVSDGLGDRLLMFDNSGAPSLELLRFRADFAQVPGFEPAPRERVRRLDQFRHPAFARVRSVQRLEPDNDLALISNCTPGQRLSEVLQQARGPAFAATLIQQLAPALILLQKHATGMSHGVLSPDRIIVGPDGRLTIVEHVVGPALATLGLRAGQLASIGVALPPSGRGKAPRLDAATDWYQLGLVAVSVLLGRPVTATELPQLEGVLDRLDHPANGDGGAISGPMRQWLERALQISGKRIASSGEARSALDDMLRLEAPRETRRVESSRREQAERTARWTNPADRLEDDVAAISRGMAMPAQPAAGTPGAAARRLSAAAAPRPLPVLTVTEPTETAAWVGHADAMAAAPPLVEAEPVMEAPVIAAAPVREAGEVVESRPQRADARTAVIDQVAARPAFEAPPAFPPLAWQTREREAPAEPAVAEPVVAEPRPAAKRRSRGGRTTVSTAVLATLGLLAAVEAGVIVGQAGALWFAPQPAVAVETSASGRQVLVTSRSTRTPGLQLAVAPDLRWVRVTTAPAAKGLAAAATGTIRISSPIELKVFEQPRLLGTVPGADIQVAPGRHDIELVNPELGYRLRQELEVKAGQIVSIQVAPPDGWVTIEAAPWAEVTIDGRAAGRTPVTTLPLAPGAHDITLEHPELGSDRQRVTVRSDALTRVTATLRR